MDYRKVMTVEPGKLKGKPCVRGLRISVGDVLRCGNATVAEADFTTNPIKAKIQQAETANVHTMPVIGPRDMEPNNVCVCLHGKANVRAKPKHEVVAGILRAREERNP